MIRPDRTYEECFRDNYGACDLAGNCRCLRNGWRGESCSHWHTIGAESAEQMIQWIKDNRDKIGYAAMPPVRKRAS